MEIPGGVGGLKKSALCGEYGYFFWDYTIGLPCLLIELFYIGMPVVRTDGLQSRDYQNFSDG